MARGDVPTIRPQKQMVTGKMGGGRGRARAVAKAVASPCPDPQPNSLLVGCAVSTEGPQAVPFGSQCCLPGRSCSLDLPQVQVRLAHLSERTREGWVDGVCTLVV